MAGRRRPEQQLVLDWTDALQWQDLPGPIRERASPLLAALLRAAAAQLRATVDTEGQPDE